MITATAFGVTLAATAAAPSLPVADIALLLTGVASFSFVTLCSTLLQLHSAAVGRGRIMALWHHLHRQCLGHRGRMRPGRAAVGAGLLRGAAALAACARTRAAGRAPRKG